MNCVHDLKKTGFKNSSGLQKKTELMLQLDSVVFANSYTEFLQEALKLQAPWY